LPIAKSHVGVANELYASCVWALRHRFHCGNSQLNGAFSLPIAKAHVGVANEPYASCVGVPPPLTVE